MTQEQVEQIWSVIQTIGGELDETLPAPALGWLVTHGFAELTEAGPQLTSKGWHAYTVLESRDREVAEIEGTAP